MVWEIILAGFVFSEIAVWLIVAFVVRRAEKQTPTATINPKTEADAEVIR